MTMIAFHGDVATKDKYLARVRMHRAADSLVQGTGWENGRGCAIGCTLEAYEHSRYETELGIPQVIARLEDLIFEGLPKADAMLWPERFLSAIPVGADLSRVWPRFAVWMLRECLGFTDDEEVHGVIDLVASLYETDVPYSDPRWRKARDQAWSLAADAAYAAAAYAYAAVGGEFWQAAADRLISLLSDSNS